MTIEARVLLRILGSILKWNEIYWRYCRSQTDLTKEPFKALHPQWSLNISIFYFNDLNSNMG